jgi:hypothetical protein
VSGDLIDDVDPFLAFGPSQMWHQATRSLQNFR